MILRTKFADGELVFEDLSDKIILTSKQRCPQKFEVLSNEFFGEEKGSIPPLSKDCFAFISPIRMEQFNIPLYADMHYTLLSERGCEIMEIGIGKL